MGRCVVTMVCAVRRLAGRAKRRDEGKVSSEERAGHRREVGQALAPHASGLTALCHRRNTSLRALTMTRVLLDSLLPSSKLLRPPKSELRIWFVSSSPTPTAGHEQRALLFSFTRRAPTLTINWSKRS